MGAFAKKIRGWGWIGVETSPSGICRISLGCPHRRCPTLKAFRDIERYLNGKQKELKLKIDLSHGTDFQKSVWRTLQKIPYGEVRSYQWVAKQIRKPKASRAVGQACGANPLPLTIPCHRVIASDGRIGGFSGGLRWKRRLLRLENKGRAKGVPFFLETR